MIFVGLSPHYRRMSIRSSCLAALAFLVARPALAAEPEPAQVAAAQEVADEPPLPAEPTAEEFAAVIAEFESTLRYEQGEVHMVDGKAVLQVPPGFRFLAAEDAQRVLEGPWGNPPDPKVLGMLAPTEVSPLDPERGWAVVVTYDESGHVDDADAASIDYDELLAAMQKDQDEVNRERRKQGFAGVALRGWAEPPRYDADNRKLYWAMRLAFTEPGEGEAEETLNYAIRVLGREGVLELNAVAPMSQLAGIKPAMEQVVGSVTFSQGNRYEDFDADTDKLAAYGIGGLIAGGLAAKTGLLKGLWLALVAGKKFIVIGLIAVGIFIKRMFSRRREHA